MKTAGDYRCFSWMTPNDCVIKLVLLNIHFFRDCLGFHRELHKIWGFAWFPAPILRLSLSFKFDGKKRAGWKISIVS